MLCVTMNESCRQSKLLLGNHYLLEECISRVTSGNSNVVWTTRRLTGRLAYCVLWLDQETEDKVAVGLIAIEQLRRSSSYSKYMYYPRYLLFSIAACVKQKRVKSMAN